MTRKSDILGDDNGTALMEFVLVMPIFVFMIFCIIQLALVCMAKQMTHYAAYSAARAAIVYHPEDSCFEDGQFRMSNGVAHRAACTALAWMCQMPGEPDRLHVPGWGDVPGSGMMAYQVAIDDLQSVMLEDVPAVKVTVQFIYPLLIPFAGQLIAYFHMQNNTGAHWTQAGALPPDMLETMGHTKIRGTPCIFLYETCIMPMPWDNSMFPRAENTPYLGTENL